MPRFAALAAVVSFAASAYAAAPRDWKTATLVETTRIKSQGITQNQAYTLDLGDRVVECTDPDISWIRIRTVSVVVGSELKYARGSDSTLFFMDTKGKEHKCVIQHEAVKPRGN